MQQINFLETAEDRTIANYCSRTLFS